MMRDLQNMNNIQTQPEFEFLIMFGSCSEWVTLLFDLPNRTSEKIEN